MQVVYLRCTSLRNARRLLDKWPSGSGASRLRLCTSAKKPERLYPTLPRRIRTNIKHFFSVIFTSDPNRDFFGEADVASRYVQDNVDVGRWCLAYDNAASAVFQRIGTAATPPLFLSISLMAIDYWATDGTFSFAYFQSMANHAVQVGDFVYVPIVGSALVFCMLMRLLNRCLFRIYVDRRDPQRLRVLVAKSGIFRKWKQIELNRADLTLPPTAFTAGERSIGAILRQLWFGHVRLAGRPYLIDESCFRSNSFNSFFFGETSRQPANLETMDLENPRLRAMLKS